MKTTKTWNLIAALAAVTITAVACQEEAETDLDITATPDGSAADTSREAAPAPVRLTGCLQEADGDYVLTTRIPDASADKPGEAQAAQLGAARDAYRLSGNDDNFEKLLGNRVQVTGTVEERADLPELAVRGGAATPQQSEPLDIDVSELAELTVTSIESSGEACGAGNARSNTPS